jgi:hypothetical protein
MLREVEDPVAMVMAQVARATKAIRLERVSCAGAACGEGGVD